MSKRTALCYLIIGIFFIFISAREFSNGLSGTLIFFGIGGLALLLNGIKGLRIKN